MIIKRKRPIGQIQIGIAEGRTGQGKPRLFVAMDQTSRFVYAALHERAGKMVAQRRNRRDGEEQDDHCQGRLEVHRAENRVLRQGRDGFLPKAFRGIPDTSRHHQCPERAQCGRVSVSHVCPEVL